MNNHEALVAADKLGSFMSLMERCKGILQAAVRAEQEQAAAEQRIKDVQAAALEAERLLSLKQDELNQAREEIKVTIANAEIVSVNAKRTEREAEEKAATIVEKGMADARSLINAAEADIEALNAGAAEMKDKNDAAEAKLAETESKIAAALEAAREKFA